MKGNDSTVVVIISTLNNYWESAINLTGDKNSNVRSVVLKLCFDEVKG